MNKPILRIAVILVFIIALPVAFFVFREVASLNENEKVIEEIYKKQLEAILFSVNQYSEDIVRSWSVGLETILENRDPSETIAVSSMLKLFNDNKAVESVFVSDSLASKNIVFRRDEKQSIIIETNNNQIASKLGQNKTLVDRLYKYKASNFLKIEPLSVEEGTENKIFIFILDDNRIGGIVINAPYFVKQNLAPKIQSVEREEFSIAVLDSVSGKVLYSSELAVGVFQQSKRLWLFPDYSLGINLKGTTIENLVRDRTDTNLFLIVGMGGLMFLIAWFGYKNIKHEVELAQIKSDFVSNVSHELRTPLALINMFTETLSMGRVKSEDKRNEYYEIIQQETERLSKIVNKILSFSKIESGKWKYNFVPTEITSMVEKIFATYKFHIQNKGFDFELIKEVDTIEGVVDPEAVSEAVINLLDNAVKYSGNGKRIVLRTGKYGTKFFIEVEDEGIGIASSDKNKIFDKFYRITSGNVHNTKGTGLGLTLVSHIVEAHKGEIILTSELGVGSRFKLVFPYN